MRSVGKHPSLSCTLLSTWPHTQESNSVQLAFRMAIRILQDGKVAETYKDRQGEPVQGSFFQPGCHGLRRYAKESSPRRHLGSSLLLLLHLEWLFSLHSVQVPPAAIVSNADSRAFSCPTHILSQCVCNQTQQSAFSVSMLIVDRDLPLRNSALMIPANRVHPVFLKRLNNGIWAGICSKKQCLILKSQIKHTTLKR